MPKVLNKSRDGIPNGAVYVGRPTKWGNPFVIGIDGDRDEVIAKHKEWFMAKCAGSYDFDPEELRGKDLVCWCAPAACHADVLLRWANDECN
jgi:hypothetical protein